MMTGLLTKAAVASVGGILLGIGGWLLYFVIRRNAVRPFGAYAVLVTVGLGALLIYAARNIDSLR